MAEKYIFLSKIATTVPQLCDARCGDIVVISNDSPEYDLYVSFEENIVDDYITIKAGEQWKDYPTNVNIATLWYKSNGSNCPFRFFGDKTVR